MTLCCSIHLSTFSEIFNAVAIATLAPKVLRGVAKQRTLVTITFASFSPQLRTSDILFCPELIFNFVVYKRISVTYTRPCSSRWPTKTKSTIYPLHPKNNLQLVKLSFFI